MGIDVQAFSINPFWYWADEDLARKIIQLQNEKIAEFCAAHPNRFAGLGSVALQHPSLAAEQMEDGVKNLGMRGFAIGGSVNGDDLSAPKFHPFWAKAEELQTLIFIHPQAAGTPIDEKRLQGNGFLDNVVGTPAGNDSGAHSLDSRRNAGPFPSIENLRGAWWRVSAFLLEPERSMPDGVSQSLQASEEAADGVSKAVLLRFRAVYARGHEAFDCRGWREPGRRRHRLSHAMESHSGGPDSCRPGI